MADPPGEGVGVRGAGQPGGAGQWLVDPGRRGEGFQGGCRLVEPVVQRAVLGHAAPGERPPLRGRPPGGRQGRSGAADLAEHLGCQVHRGAARGWRSGHGAQAGDHREDVVQRVPERITHPVRGRRVRAQLLRPHPGHIRGQHPRGSGRNRVQRRAERLGHLFACRLAGVELQQIGAQAGGSQPGGHHLECGCLLRHHQHRLARVQQGADHVRDRLALARAGRAVDHERAASERGGNAGQLRGVGGQDQRRNLTG